MRLAPWKTPISTYASSPSRHAAARFSKREVVLPREVLDVLGDRLEAPVARMLGLREVLEEPWELVEEAIGVHGEGEARTYRWLVTPARSGSSDGGSYHERA